MPECILKAIVRPMSRKDIFYGGSVMQLAEEQVGRVLNWPTYRVTKVVRD